MDVLAYNEVTGKPTLVKEKNSNRVYELTYDVATDTLFPTYNQTELVYKDGVVVEGTHLAENNSGNDDGSGSSTQNPPDQSSGDDWGITPEEEDIAEKIASGHAWDDHVADSDGDLNGEFDSQEEFAQEIKDIIENPDDHARLKDGREAWWDDQSETIVIHDPKNPDKGTAFRPDIGKEYFNRNFKNKK